MRDLNTFFDDSPFGIFLSDADGHASYANRAFGEVTGREPGQLLGLGWLDAVQPADRDHALQEWRAACAAGGRLDMVLRTARPDGSRRFLRLRSRPVAPGEYVAVLMDHTEQVLAERRLRRSNELLGAVLENIPCGIAVYDADASLVLDNQRAHLLLDLSAGPDDAGTDFAAIPPERRPDRPAPAQPEPQPTGCALGEAEVAPRVRQEVQPDGRVFEVREAPMPSGGLVTTYTDITEQKQHIDTLREAKTAAEQALKAKAAFLATMSHEIRTPMNGVIGMTNILLETPLTPDQREVVEVIRDSGESLLVVINDILDYSKIESGRMELEWLPLRLRDVLDSCVLLLSAKAAEKGVALTVDLDARVPPLILGDRTRLQQVFMNLVSNAVKFTENGEVRISLAASRRLAAGRAQNPGDVCELEVQIEDTGIGIPPDTIDSIFDPFVQGDSSTARRFGGTGLGLAIAKRLVQAMGGSISLESEVGRGTRVCFTFLAEAAVPRCRSTADHGLPLWLKRVLLVTGTRADVGVLHARLRRWGMEVELCASASQARARLLKGDPADMLLAAAHISDARWLAFVRSLRDQGISVPAVLLSRTRKAAWVDEAQGACIVARSSSEATLYDALADALRAAEPADAPGRSPTQFDLSLAQSAPLGILVAEDNAINRKVVLRTLEGFGYRADVARNGAEAIEAVQRRHYDLVLMDIQMPEVDGLQATRFITQQLPAARRPRVVAMSANVMREDVEAALAAGACQYLAKPFSPGQLRAALEDSACRRPAQEPAGPEDALLAPDRLRCHLQIDPTGGFLADLCRDFARAAGEFEARLCAMVQAQAAADVRAVVHEYAGVCAVVGAQKLTELLLQLQTMARTGSVAAARPLVQQCAQIRQRTVAALESALRATAPARADAREAPTPASAASG